MTDRDMSNRDMSNRDMSNRDTSNRDTSAGVMAVLSKLPFSSMAIYLRIEERELEAGGQS